MNHVDVDVLRRKAQQLRDQSRTTAGLAAEDLAGEAARLDDTATRIELASILEQKVA